MAAQKTVSRKVLHKCISENSFENLPNEGGQTDCAIAFY